MTEYKSQIRDSEIVDLADRVARKDFGKYLLRIRMEKLRAFRDRSVSFDFPVTALVGPNGGGKTTILGAAAIAYEGVAPRQFFAKSGKLDGSMLNWKAEYELIDRSVSKNDSFRRTASFTSLKWSRDAAKRGMAVFGVARTVPASERRELRKCATNTFRFDGRMQETIKDPVGRAVARILGKDISKYSHIRIDKQGRVSILPGVTEDGDHFSEFHFGAGESSIIRMVMQIEALADNSLILIEEIENGLHPLATIRLVEYLIDLARRKKAQSIFTTHSNDALRVLPPRAIWAAVNGELYQGKLDIAALRAMSGQVDARLAIFCEDAFAEAWLSAVLRGALGVAREAVELHSMQGDGTAVKVAKHHNESPASKFPAACFIDGDSRQRESSEGRIFRLPGEMPEAYVFDRVVDRTTDLGGVLAVRLLRPHSDTDSTIKKLRELRRANRDPHVLYSEIGMALGLIPESTVRDAFLATWTDAYPEECERILANLGDLLPRVRPNAAQFDAG